MHLQFCVNERWLLQDFKTIPSTFVHNLCIFIQKLCVITNWQGEMTSFILFRTIYNCTSVHKLILQYEMSQLLLWYKYQHYIWVKYLKSNWIELNDWMFLVALSGGPVTPWWCGKVRRSVWCHQRGTRCFASSKSKH